MLIKNIYIHYSGHLPPQLKHVLITPEGYKEIFSLDAVLTAVEENESDIIDAKGHYSLMPGMLDAHVHGQGGPDFADIAELPEEEGLPVITAALGKTGLSYAMATFVSLELAVLKKALKVLNTYVQAQAGNPTPGSTNIVGVHLEGPFISKQCRGAHAADVLQEQISLKVFKEIIAAAPAIKQWKITIAADLPGALKFIQQTKKLEEEGIFIKVFIGHCNPDTDFIDKAIAAGAAGFTHLGNACQESCSRETRPIAEDDVQSNLVKWVLENPETCPPGIELIVDGVHLSPSFVSLIKRTLGAKIILVTDALGPSGLEDNGRYKLGTLNIRKESNSFYLIDQAGNFIMKNGYLPNGQQGLVKSLAGSAASLAYCVQKYGEFTAHLEDKVERMRSIYSAVVQNPRQSSLSAEAIANLPDDRNFVIFNRKGQLVLSLCNSKLTQHQPFKKVGDSTLLSQQGFLSLKIEHKIRDIDSNDQALVPGSL